MRIHMTFRRAGIVIAGALLASMTFGSAAAYAAPSLGAAIKNAAEAAQAAQAIQTTEQAAQTTAQTAADDYVFPQSSYELLYDGNFAGMTKEQLRIGRNEIYARHGRRFNDAALQQYFDSKSWYHGTIAPEAFNESVLNTWEKRNVIIIRNAEQGPFANVSSAPAAQTQAAQTQTYQAQGAASADEHVTPLSAEELNYMNRLLTPKYSGFFTCEYASPLDIIWGSVFYSGFDGREIGMHHALTREYESVTGEEVYTDVTAIRKVDVESIVLETTGTNYCQARHPLDGDWVWLPGLQAYAYEHGDTNLVGIEFTAGEYSGDDLRLYYSAYGKDYTVTLRKNGRGGWWFYSNVAY